MKMFVWSDHCSFLVVAHAKNTNTARLLALKEIGPLDGSCPNREKVVRHIREVNPQIWIGETADFAIEEGDGVQGRTDFS